MTARRTEPSRSLTDQRKPHDYVPSIHTPYTGILAQWRAAQKSAKEQSK